MHQHDHIPNCQFCSFPCRDWSDLEVMFIGCDRLAEDTMTVLVITDFKPVNGPGYLLLLENGGWRDGR